MTCRRVIHQPLPCCAVARNLAIGRSPGTIYISIALCDTPRLPSTSLFSAFRGTTQARMRSTLILTFAPVLVSCDLSIYAGGLPCLTDPVPFISAGSQMTFESVIAPLASAPVFFITQLMHISKLALRPELHMREHLDVFGGSVPAFARVGATKALRLRQLSPVAW